MEQEKRFSIPTKKMLMTYKVTLEIPETMSRIAVSQQLHLKFGDEASLVGNVISSSTLVAGEAGEYDTDV